MIRVKSYRLLVSPLAFVLLAFTSFGLEAPDADLQTNLIRQAEAGSANAQANLASMYWYNGHFDLQGSRPVDADHPAFKKCGFWARRAAAQGDINAQYLLGTLYRDGYGVRKDLAVARSWFFQAASKGNGVASIQMAESYEKDWSSPTNGIECYAWFLASTNYPQVRVEAQRNLRAVASIFGSNDVAIAERRATELRRGLRGRVQ